MNKKQTTTKRMTIPNSSEEAYELLYDEIAAVPDDQMTRIASDIDYSHQIVLTAAPRIERYLPELAQLPFYNLDLVCKIRLYNAACWQAHLIVVNPLSLDPKAPALVEEAGELRKQMLTSAELLVMHGHVPEEIVAAIRKGQGNVDMTHDCKHLAGLFRKIPKPLREKVLVTNEMIDRSSQLGDQLAQLFGIKNLGAEVDLNHPNRMRQKAYTLLARSYEEGRRGIGFLRGPYGDADDIAPSLYLKQRKRGPGAVVEQDADAVTTTTAPAPAPEPAPAPAATTEVVSTA